MVRNFGNWPIRFQGVAEPIALDVVTILGLTTVMLSATMGLAATDIKRVIAYSTLNSLGLMFVVEYLYRIVRYRHHHHPTLLEGIRAVLRSDAPAARRHAETP